MDSWDKYDKPKTIGGIYKKGRLKGQKEVIDLLKASDKCNFETVMEVLNGIDHKVENIEQRLGVIEQKLGITQQTQ